MNPMNAPEPSFPAPQRGNDREPEALNPLILGLAWMLAGKVIREAQQRARYLPAGGGALGGSAL